MWVALIIGSHFHVSLGSGGVEQSRGIDLQGVDPQKEVSDVVVQLLQIAKLVVRMEYGKGAKQEGDVSSGEGQVAVNSARSTSCWSRW